MNIAVVAGRDREILAKTVMKALAAEKIGSYGLRFGRSWRTLAPSRVENALAKASHILCIADPTSMDSTWFAYVLGWARATRRPLCIYKENKDVILLPWLQDLPCCGDSHGAVQHYLSLREAWELQEKRSLARASLLEMGISWHTDSFAQCVREGDTKAVELFLDSGYLPGVRDKHGVPILSLAVRSKHQPVAQLALDRGAELDAQSDDRGYTALMDAVQMGDRVMVDFLLGRGASTDITSKDGQSALVIAVGRNDVPMSKTLLDAGANPDLADKLGLSAKKYAALFHNPDMTALFS